MKPSSRTPSFAWKQRARSAPRCSPLKSRIAAVPTPAVRPIPKALKATPMLLVAMLEPSTGDPAAIGLSVQSVPTSRWSRTASGTSGLTEAGSAVAATASTRAPAAIRPSAAKKKRASTAKVPGKSFRKKCASARPVAPRLR